MKRVALLSALVVAGLVSTTAARADVPVPPKDLPEGKTAVSIQVTHDPDKDVSFLYIGRQALETASPKAEKQSQWTPGPTRSIVAAMALSLGIAGLFFLRGKRGAQIACGMVLAAGLGVLSAEAWGNAAPVPPPAQDLKFKLDPVWNLTTREGKKVFNGDAVVVLHDWHDVRLVIGTKPKPKRDWQGPPVNPPVPAPPPNSAPPSGAPAPNAPNGK
jgi:hypothetical protein